MFLLKFTSHHDGSIWYFQNLGDQWPNSTNRLIERTCPEMDRGRLFESPEKAREVLVSAGNPKNWQVIDENGMPAK